MKVRATAYQSGIRLAAEDLLQPRLSCPLDGTTDTQELLLLQDDPSVWLRNCDTCKATFASRVPTKQALDRYYRDYYPSTTDARVTVHSPARLGRHIAKAAENHGLRGFGGILDFGGGDGSNAIAARQALLELGVTLSDIDVVDPASSPQDRDRRGVKYATELEKVGHDYSLVIASSVLEHLAAPLEKLADLLSRMRPGGLLYARTPHVAPLLQRASRFGVALDFTYPGHLFDLGGDFWDALPAWWQPNGAPYRMVLSRTSIIETSLTSNPARTSAAMVMKVPARIVGARWRYSGGWEVLLRRY